MSQGAPGWYRHFLASVVVPHAQLFGYAIEVAEVVVGSILIGTAVAVLIGRVSVLSRLLGWSAVAASAAALLMVVDFELANGGGFGLSLAKDTFDEGVDLDTLLTGLQLALGTFWVAALRQRSPQEPISNSRRTSLRSSSDRSARSASRRRARRPIWNVPAGNSFGRVPGTTTARGGT